ncbi:M20/M25/M40 family metallo-hydrolase, partial [Haloparvum sedimenti]|uniref:M20/M25/M40 family metallo-hydrolase n=1 Tax=Haloparvum sedimenti TaxID=1678448 RepID=UPI000F78C2AF
MASDGEADTTESDAAGTGETAGAESGGVPEAEIVAGGDGDHPDACDTPARKLLYDLVSIPSPSGEEAAAAERLQEFFAANGREAWIDEVGNVRAPADDSVLLTSHVDTVPGDIPVAVKPAEAYEEDGPALWGRGTVDATGPLVAMAVAAVATGVSFVGVVGEETDSRGARHLVADRDA